ncbi:MAG: transglutaminase-like putative cysteine protease, partial [Halobacteriales archaeon]
AAWAPVRVSDELKDRTEVSVTKSLLVDRPVSVNQTITVVSRVRTPTPEQLRGAGTDYPRGIERTYTDLPSSVPDRVETRTDEITADAETPYAKAVAIEGYLERSKTYSLNISRPAGNIADSFLFEMDRGYCQYFATTMVVMLRTQGIPARYATGFTPGQSVSENTYLVRGLNAHAWVEVYFPDEGWVRFDPTPASPRTQMEQGAVEQARGEGLPNVDANGSGGASPSFPSGNDTFAGGSPAQKNSSAGSSDGNQGEGQEEEKTGEAEDDSQKEEESNDSSEGSDSETGTDDEEEEDQSNDDDSATEEPQGPIRFDVHPDPIPGRVVTVNVTRGGEPVKDAVVQFNGDRIGMTDENGSVSGAVPYTRTLNVTVIPPDAKNHYPTILDGASIQPQFSAAGDRWYSLESPSIAASPSETAQNEALGGTEPVKPNPMAVSGALQGTTGSEYRGKETGADRDFDGVPIRSNGNVSGNGTNTTTYDLDTTIFLTVNQDPIPGRTVVFRATIDEVPVANARVVIDGQFRGKTNETGKISVDLPYRSNVSVEITRNAAALNRSLPLLSDVTLDIHQPVAGTEKNLSATVGGQPLRDALVRIDGAAVGRTDETGSLGVTLPYQKNLTVSVTRGAIGKAVDVSVSGELSLTASSDVLPTKEARIGATLGGHPVENATVAVDRNRTARTNATGIASVVVPYEKNMTVTVRRGEFTENTTLRVEESMSVVLSGQELPTRPITLNATIGGVPVDNGTVYINGERGLLTGSNGETTVSLPIANTVTIRVERGEFSTKTTLEWLLLPVLLPMLVLTVIVGSGIAARRRGVRVTLAPRRWGRAIVHRVLSALVVLSEIASNQLDRGKYLLAKLQRLLRRLYAEIRQAPTLRARLTVFAAVFKSLRSRLQSLLAVIRAVDPALIVTALSGRRTTEKTPVVSNQTSGSAVVDGEPADDDAGAAFDVVAAWMDLESRTGIRDRRTKTPGEIGRKAAAKGWQRKPVETLLRAYRRVTYADRSLEPEHRQRARQAFDEILAEHGGGIKWDSAIPSVSANSGVKRSAGNRESSSTNTTTSEDEHNGDGAEGGDRT